MSAGLRAGYKQTEVGVIPEDWSEAALSALVERGTKITYGVVKPGSNDLDGVLFIRGGDIFAGRIDERQLRRIPKAVSAQYKRTLLVGGEILVSLVGYPGESALVPPHLRGANIARQVALVRLSNQLPIIPGFVCKFLQSDLGRRQLLKEALGSAQQVINLRDIQKVTVAIPSTTTEQRAIAAALSDVDALLGGLDSLIDKKQGLKVAAMQQLLTGQTRLPGFSREWEVRPLASAIAGLEAGISVNSVEHGKPLGSGEPCILKTSAIFDGCFDPEECKLIDRRDISRAKLSPRRDTIIISRMNTPNLVGEVGYVHHDFPTLNLPDRLWMTRFDPNSDICARWLAYVLSSPQVKQNIKGLASGTSGSMKNIGKGKLLALQLEFPTGEEQAAIAGVLSDMDTDLAALQARRSKTQALKQAMMQELLTGRIRLV